MAAAASANSLFASLVSGPGQARSQADDTLSLCFQAQTALVLVGLTSSRALAKTLALLHSIASTTLFLVLPDVEPSPRPCHDLWGRGVEGGVGGIKIIMYDVHVPLYE